MAETNGVQPESSALDRELLVDFGHQLRNQLNAIVGAAGLLAATATSSDQRELASIVLSGSEELAGMVDEVLDSDLIQSDDFELALHPFSIRASTEACVSRVRPAASGKRVELVVTYGDGVPASIVGDSRRLEQVLHSLLRLAVDRTDAGTIDVRLSAEGGEGPLRLRFHISDPGLALPARLVEAGLRDGRTEGLGPGERLDAVSLHTTQHIVEMMDGDLTIAAGAGARGAEIAFTFLALPSASGDADRSLTGMQVLLVAADPMERRVLAMQTELWGAPSTPVAPEDAVELVSGDRVFDVALIEHRRPAVDGLAIAGAIRARRDHHELPIVLVVAGAVGAEEVTAADSGVVQATLAKPVTPERLREVLAQVGRRRAAAAAPAAAPAESGATLRVLVADDNSLNQNMLRRQIARLGHQVDVVSNGRQAVDALGQQAYDALLMDVLMPEMDGLTAASEIVRRWTPGARPRLIALTAMAGPGDEERCRKAGFDDYMSKPVHLDELAEALQAAAGWRAAPKTLG
ncbi:MAG TPA: response regulator [Candidatus Dormibacteraeota bacterium]|nr:response regulator [Candidatus Dormibacteraeota bacterium]